MGQSIPLERIVSARVDAGRPFIASWRLIAQRSAECDLCTTSFTMRIEEVGVSNVLVYGTETVPIKVTCNCFGENKPQIFPEQLQVDNCLGCVYGMVRVCEQRSPAPAGRCRNEK